MGKRSGNPALYELIRTRPSGAISAPPEVRPGKDPVAPSGAHDQPWLMWLTPGRSVRVPVGYLLLGIAGVMALICVSYMVGSSRGSAYLEEQLEQRRREQYAAADIGQQVVEPPISANRATNGRSTSPAPANRGNPAADPGLSSGVAGPVKSDPRQVGINYYRLVGQLPETNATGVANFCRQHGLEAYAVREDNGRSFKVIVLPGLKAGEFDSELGVRLKAAIENVRRKWMSQSPRNRDDLAGYIPEKFKG